MKVQILVLAFLLAIVQSLSRVEQTHQEVYTDSYRGCRKGYCWTFCFASPAAWCYTKATLSKDDNSKIPCSGEEYNDPSCPYYEDIITANNCATTCVDPEGK